MSNETTTRLLEQARDALSETFDSETQHNRMHAIAAAITAHLSEPTPEAVIKDSLTTAASPPAPEATSDRKALAEEVRRLVAEYASSKGVEDVNVTYRELQSAIDRLASAPLPAGWRPIETAPKDGRWMLITNGSQLENSYWDGAFGRSFPWRNRGGNGWRAEWPTHWMPLPAAPSLPPAEQPKGGM